MRLFVLTMVVLMALALSAACFAEGPAPLSVVNKAIGGGALNQYTPGVEGGQGANNIGLLIRTWGKVTFVDSANKYFYINDGSGRADGSGHVGIRVSYDNLAAGNSISAPGPNDYLAITGISSTVLVSSKVRPNLRPRRQSDIQTITTP